MVAVITSAVSSLGPDLLAVAGIGIGISATVFGVKKGWGLLRGMVKC